MVLEPLLRGEELDALRRVDTCTVSNAIETFELRLRNTGFADAKIRCAFEDFPPIVGYAATARLRTGEPPIAGRTFHDRTDWWNSILQIPTPRIAVIEDMDQPPGVGAFVGDMRAAILLTLGCVGYVTNGAVWELLRVRDLGLQLFAGNVAVSHAYAHLFDLGAVVKVDGLEIHPGDLLHGDQHGLLNVPKEIAAGTLPPVVLKFDASSLPVALVTVNGKGLSETQLHDYAEFQIRNQIAVVPGAEIPVPFGGKYRQIMVYVDPYKLLSRQLSLMDVVGAVNDSNLILPAGDVKIGPYDYFVYSNSLVDNMNQLANVPLKVRGHSWVTVNDVGKAEDANQIQYNELRIDGQKSVYIPIMKQGGDTNTIAVVDGVRQLIKHLYDIPRRMVASIVFDQSVYVKEAIHTVLHEGFLGLILTSLMILIFLGSFRATSAVLLSIPLSALAAFVVLALMGGTVNTMILGGMALAFSRVIDNSVISLENIYRHLEMGAVPAVAAEVGGAEVNLAVLAATLVDVVDFFPVVFLYGVAKFLFSALALAFCLSLLASFVVAMTVIPLFCSRFLKAVPHAAHEHGKTEEYEIEPTTPPNHSWIDKFNARFNRMFNKILDYYEHWVRRAVQRPGLTVAAIGVIPAVNIVRAGSPIVVVRAEVVIIAGRQAGSVPVSIATVPIASEPISKQGSLVHPPG
jgi:regulator of RNase E activity RraA